MTSAYSEIVRSISQNQFDYQYFMFDILLSIYGLIKLYHLVYGAQFVLDCYANLKWTISSHNFFRTDTRTGDKVRVLNAF